jgi:hypothetical protein
VRVSRNRNEHRDGLGSGFSVTSRFGRYNGAGATVLKEKGGPVRTRRSAGDPLTADRFHGLYMHPGTTNEPLIALRA